MNLQELAIAQCVCIEEIESIEMKALENSEEYQTLSNRNSAWARPKPTEQEKGEWQLLKEKAWIF